MERRNRDCLLKTLLEVVSSGLRPYVEEKMRSRYGATWQKEIESALNASPNRGPDDELDLNDPYVLLKTLKTQWDAVFAQELGWERRALVVEVIEIRNALVHNRSVRVAGSREDFSLENTHRSLDIMHRLLSAIAAPEAAEVQKLKQEIFREIQVDATSDVKRPERQTGKTSTQPKKPGTALKLVSVVPAAQVGRLPQQALPSLLQNHGAETPAAVDPFAHFHPAYLLTPALIRRMDAEVTRRQPQRRGWILIDACNPDPSAVWIHVRSYVSDRTDVPTISKKRKRMPRRFKPWDYREKLPEGFRLQYADKDFIAEAWDTDYPAVFVNQGDDEISQWAFEFIAGLQMRSFPYLVIAVADDSDKITVFEDDARRALPSEMAPLRAGRIEIELNGHNHRTLDTLLPFDFVVRSEAPAAALDVKIPGDGFSSESYHFLIRDPANQPIGEATFRINAALATGKPDEIILEPGSDRPLTVQNWDRSQITRGGFDGPLTLHVIFDRTTLDDAAWPHAFETLERGTITDAIDELAPKLATGNASTGPSWNQNLRRTLAARLPAAIAQFQVQTTLDLWWFADISRDEIAANDNLPKADAAYARVGRSSIDSLPGDLSERHFDYATGFDLFDAVDEVLNGVAGHISHEIDLHHMNHVVLIVGDSPPPPGSTSDVLWKQLVEQPIRTNARRSDQFGRALRALEELNVPVGWLFIRPGKSSWTENANAVHVSRFLWAANLRGRVLDALQKIADIHVEDTAGSDDMGRALTSLFAKLAASKSAISGVQITRVIGSLPGCGETKRG
jgi:hypothetical protein